MYTSNSDDHKSPNLYLAIIGSKSSGKSQLVNRYVNNNFNKEIMSTIGKSCHVIEKSGNIIKIIDMSWRQLFLPINLKSLQYVDGAILVYNVTNKDTFDDAQEIMSGLKNYRKIKSFPMIIVASSIDLKEQRCITTDQGQKFAKNYKKTYFEVSSLTGEGVNDAFNSLISSMSASVKTNAIVNKESEPVGNHNKDHTSKEVKLMLTAIESENNNVNLLQKINELEAFLEEMKPIHCDFNYQKYFILLFRKVNLIDSINNKKVHISIFIYNYL